MSEFVYVLENLSMPGLLKIGKTERTVSQRVSELSSHTGIPTGFTITKEYCVVDASLAERTIHERLSEYRVADNREFFRIESEDAIEIIESLLNFTKPAVRNFEREDQLVARAINIVTSCGVARPRVLEEALEISYEESLFVIELLRGRGIIGEFNECKWSARTQISNDALIERPSSHSVRPATIAATPMIGNYQLPSMDFLQQPNLLVKSETKEELFDKARLIQQTLSEFEIVVELGDITKGPTFTRYEFHVAPGIRLEEIALQQSNLVAALRVVDINILTPVPGKGTVGIEVPNPVKTKVILRNMLESDEWRNSKAKIPLALGKDVYGHPIISDLTEMPHLLIAGNTGSGKSICIHSIIASLLYRFSPDQLRFLMIDPKFIELQQYNSLPHLVAPVITEPEKVIFVLNWIVNEMEMRYQIFAKVGARNIDSFNGRSKTETNLSSEPFAVKADGEFIAPSEMAIILPEKLSYLVLIVEASELVEVGIKKEVKAALIRIVQMGRTAGIHCIIASQRPSNEGIGELFKTDIISRVAFKCTSRIDSRLALGQAGAEKLLGAGDMLIVPHSSPKLSRAQAAFISDHEVRNIIAFISKQAQPSYDLEIHRRLSKPVSAFADENDGPEDEVIIQQCIEVIRGEQKASVSILQRRLRLGYGRAARLLDELENRGFVGPSKGTELRDILIDLHLHPFPSREEPPAIASQRFKVSMCQNCGGKIEFDLNEVGDRSSLIVPCPHCEVNTEILPPP